MDTLLGALEDFRYETLVLGLDGDTRGDMTVTVALRGSNPNFQEGRPVEFNLNVEARLADLVRAGQLSTRVPEAVEERIRAVTEKKRRQDEATR